MDQSSMSRGSDIVVVDVPLMWMGVQARDRIPGIAACIDVGISLQKKGNPVSVLDVLTVTAVKCTFITS